jgi:23S rRNA (uracil1939-C5)-methyltransferase
VWVRAGGAIASERVEVTGIAAGGAGVGRLPDGRAVFVHRTAPGEDVGVRLLDEKRRWARAELVSIQTPSPDRREAPCPHYDRCGGCTLEHLAYPAQLRAKASIVAEALRRIGNVDIGEPEVTASPAEFRYRNRVSFSLVRLGAGRVVAGFHELNHPNRVIDISDACLLPEQPIADVWSKLRAAWGPDARRLPSGRRLRLTLRASAAGEVVLLVDGGYGAGDTPGLLAAVPGLTAVWHRPRAGSTQLLGGAEQVTEDWQDEELALSGTMFLQVNRAAAALLEEHVLEMAGPVSGLRVVDAYCGVGLHARRLARAGAIVRGIELDPEAVEEARRSVPPEVEILSGRTEELLPQALPADLVILNPPRAGLDAEVPAALRGMAQRLIYVSCNPATLARDLARMNPDFRLRSVRCFDLFPQTAHVESVAVLDCATT